MAAIESGKIKDPRPIEELRKLVGRIQAIWESDPMSFLFSAYIEKFWRG